MKTIKLGGIIIACTFMITILGRADHLAAANQNILAVNSQLPATSLTTPTDQTARDYLGLENRKSFSSDEIKK